MRHHPARPAVAAAEDNPRMNDQLLWYTTRAAGTVSLVLLSAVTVLGLLARARAEAPGWPRFLTAALHRDLALTSVVFLVLHIVTAVVDPFTSLGLTAAVIPFGSYYRTFWLGLGTVAFELLLAIVATSLLRHVIGLRAWRAVHWLAYASWPIAVAHGLGTGTDAGTAWLLGTTILCCGAVVAAVAYRFLSPGDPLAHERRLAAMAASDGSRR
jgi:sulfoxide reductase heme-binding subunit YedZ